MSNDISLNNHNTHITHYIEKVSIKVKAFFKTIFMRITLEGLQNNNEKIVVLNHVKRKQILLVDINTLCKSRHVIGNTKDL